MRDPALGPVARAAEGFAAAVRRRQRTREPRVTLYSGPGYPEGLAPGARGHDELLALASELVDLCDRVESVPPDGRTRRDADPGV